MAAPAPVTEEQELPEFLDYSPADVVARWVASATRPPMRLPRR